ncbi:MAG: amidophosphoribosyltransferase [Oscillospiraceae bacterium]|nr:amidophosphoribosyltransferase [Oscillospiraceae bacterium]
MTFGGSQHIHEECGIFGICSQAPRDVAGLAYYALYALQHRGQESAGIVVNDGGIFSSYKDVGLVGDIFTSDVLDKLGQGEIAVGHVRYATTGADNIANVQPVVINHHKGQLALAHNGNLTNTSALRKELEEKGMIFHSTTDSEVIAYIIVQERLRCGSIEAAVSAAMDRIEGAYSLVISSPAKLIAARDEFGFRPLCYGTMPDGSIAFASESCALDSIGATLVRDLKPGEIAIVEDGHLRFDTAHCGKRSRRMCAFEYVYFARPDSIVDGTNISRARQRAGEYLAQEHPVDADVVIGVPDSGLDAAIGYSRVSGIPFVLGFTKNKYIGRTFISPGQENREAGVNIKLNPIREAVEGKRVVLIDDSIVRGTTSRRIAEQLWAAGAKEIHMRISAPPFVAPCYYGTDVDDTKGLIAVSHTVEEIARLIKVTSLGYLSRERLVLLTGKDEGFCTACFGGEYPTAIAGNIGKNRFDTPRPRKLNKLQNRKEGEE